MKTNLIFSCGFLDAFDLYMVFLESFLHLNYCISEIETFLSKTYISFIVKSWSGEPKMVVFCLEEDDLEKN